MYALPCRFLHLGIEFEASSGHLRHDCYLHSILFLLGIHLASGVLVRTSLVLCGLRRMLAASQVVSLMCESDAGIVVHLRSFCILQA